MGWLTTARRLLDAMEFVQGAAGAIGALADGDYLGAAFQAAASASNLLGFLKACFAGDMLVLTRERGAVRWDELREGEEVWSQDEFDPNAAGAWKRVEEIFRTEAFIWKLRVAGQEIKTTDEHPFWVVGKGWVPAKELRPGDRLRGHDGERYPVESIAPTDEFVPVYNARIAEYHTYFVQAPGGGVWIWAHNACSPAQFVANKAAGKAAEAAARTWLKSKGIKIIGEQVSIMTSKGRRVVDFLVEKGGKYLAIEVKSGNAALKMKQHVKDMAMAASGGTTKLPELGKVKLAPLPTIIMYF